MGAAKEKSHLKRCICGGKLSSCLKLVSTTGDHIINIKLGLIYHQGAFIHQIILKLDFDCIALDFGMVVFFIPMMILFNPKVRVLFNSDVRRRSPN